MFSTILNTLLYNTPPKNNDQVPTYYKTEHIKGQRTRKKKGNENRKHCNQETVPFVVSQLQAQLHTNHNLTLILPHPAFIQALPLNAQSSELQNHLCILVINKNQLETSSYKSQRTSAKLQIN